MPTFTDGIARGNGGELGWLGRKRPSRTLEVCATRHKEDQALRVFTSGKVLIRCHDNRGSLPASCEFVSTVAPAPVNVPTKVFLTETMT